ncbi:MAG: alkene reductase [Ferruginibacter sp.]
MNQKHPRLFSPYKLGNIELANRIVMAPMTRSRAIGNIPNDLIATYYGQRATAGLIITEGTSPSPNGLGYSRIPGLFNDDQVKGWKLVTDEVHAKGGKIFVQLMHTGRITHTLNLPEGGKVIAPSAIAATNTQMWTDSQGMQPLPVPEAIATGDIPSIIAEFVHSAQKAIEAGFDGVELHSANGYLLEQFLNPASNQRTDAYGGSAENRNKFVLEVAQAVVNAIGKDRVGIRLSPFGAAGEMVSDNNTESQYASLATGLKEIGVVYVHMVNHADLGAPPVPVSVEQAVRKAFGSTIIISGGYNADKAEADLLADEGELVAFGRPFINNPDLVNRFAQGLPLSDALDTTTFYTPGEKGYTDYPVAINDNVPA